MRYDNAGDLRLGQLFVDHTRQLQAYGVVDAARVNVGYLIACDVGYVQKLGHCADQLLDSESDRVPGSLGVAGASGGDRASCCEDGHIRNRSVNGCLEVLSDKKIVQPSSAKVCW